MANKVMMNSLLKRCEFVYMECGGKNDQQKEDKMVAEKGADAFEKLKVDIVNLLKKVRQELKDKEQLEKRESNSSGVIKLKNSINKGIKKLEQDHTQLKTLVNPKRRLGKKLDEATVAKRNEEVELVGKHIAEVREVMRATHRKVDPNDPDLAPRASARQQLDLDKLPIHDPTKSQLPEIDISAGLAELDRKQKIIDDALDEVSRGLDRLGEHAKNFSTTLDTQNAMIDEATKKAENSTNKLRALNVKLEDTIKTVGAQKYVMVTIIIVVIAVVIGVILLIAQNMFL